MSYIVMPVYRLSVIYERGEYISYSFSTGNRSQVYLVPDTIKIMRGSVTNVSFFSLVLLNAV